MQLSPAVPGQGKRVAALQGFELFPSGSLHSEVGARQVTISSTNICQARAFPSGARCLTTLFHRSCCQQCPACRGCCLRGWRLTDPCCHQSCSHACPAWHGASLVAGWRQPWLPRRGGELVGGGASSRGGAAFHVPSGGKNLSRAPGGLCVCVCACGIRLLVPCPPLLRCPLLASPSAQPDWRVLTLICWV